MDDKLEIFSENFDLPYAQITLRYQGPDGVFLRYEINDLIRNFLADNPQRFRDYAGMHLLSVGQRLIYFRREHGWTQSEFAAKCKLPQPMISRFENDRRSPAARQHSAWHKYCA